MVLFARCFIRERMISLATAAVAATSFVPAAQSTSINGSVARGGM
jgi:hypothetical protein